jgi:hypothetical protein
MKQLDTQKVYDNVMHRFKFGGLSTPGLYLDETVMRMCFTHRRLISQLALNLVAEGEKQKAAEVLAMADKEIPDYNVPHDYQCGSLDIVGSYIAVGQNDKAQRIIDQLWSKSSQYMAYYLSMEPSHFKSSERECIYHFYVMDHLASLVERMEPAKSEKYYRQVEEIAKVYRARGGNI